MWQYPIKITNIQVDIILIIPKLIDKVPSHAKRDEWLKWLGICHISSQRGKIPRKCGQEDLTIKEAWEGHAQPNEDVIQCGAITPTED